MEGRRDQLPSKGDRPGRSADEQKPRPL